MNIFKTFEIFLREPLSVFRDRIIQIVNVNSNLISQASVSAELLDNKTQITIVNSEKMYNLFQTVMHKQEARAIQKLLPTSNQKKQLVLGQLLKRQ